MYITWLGHSCFRLESAGYGLVIDPYRVVAGYPPLRVEANAVYISHHHFDHDCLEAVTLLPGGENPFTVETFSTFHDDCQGALRGDNTVHIFRAEGMTVVHLGDLGCALTAAQEEKISGCDALMLPVGGTYTIDAAAAAELVGRLHPRLVLPMHFRRGEQGFPELTTLEDFLSRLPEQPVHRLTEETLDLKSNRTSGIVIFPVGKGKFCPVFVRKMSKNQSRYKPLRFRVH
ncbi:MAG: MBL fold metallo-hydrolase [Vescimonas sp.]